MLQPKLPDSCSLFSHLGFLFEIHYFYLSCENLFFSSILTMPHYLIRLYAKMEANLCFNCALPLHLALQGSLYALVLQQ